LKRFASYQKKDYRFTQSIVTDGLSVSIPLCRTQQDGNTSRRKKRKKSRQNADSNGVNIYSSLQGRSIVGVDPGKHTIVYLTSDESVTRGNDKSIKRNRMQISNVQRRRALGSKIHNYINRKHKEKHLDWMELEKSISSTSKKATSVMEFQEYLKKQFAVQDKLYQYYSNLLFRIHRWWKYRNGKRFQHHMVQKIKKKFGADCVLAYGTWTEKKQMRGLIPSQSSGMRKALAKHFTVVNTPEPNTTKTCSKCMEGEMKKCEERKYPYWKKREENPDKMLDVRGLRRCNNVSCAIYVHRDYNAAVNIRFNLLHMIQNGDWHPKFKPDEKKVTGPDNSVEQAGPNEGQMC